jgi:hypothetical protein
MPRYPEGMQNGSRARSHLRELVVALLALGSAARGAVAQSAPLMPVFLEQGGPRAVQVEIAAGRVGPCDSAYNARLFHGWVDPGRTLRVMSPYGCVCYRHTYDDFPRVNWSPSTITCRRSCTVQGGYSLCPADPNDALFIQIRSSPQ